MAWSRRKTKKLVCLGGVLEVGVVHCIEYRGVDVDEGEEGCFEMEEVFL